MLGEVVPQEHLIDGMDLDPEIYRRPNLLKVHEAR